MNHDDAVAEADVRGEDSVSADIAAARITFERAIAAIEAAWALLCAELQLARSSAIAIAGFAMLLVFFGVGAWLATSGAIAAGIYELTGNVFYGIAVVAIANIVGAALMLLAIRRCWRDVSLPRTRRAIGDIARPGR